MGTSAKRPRDAAEASRIPRRFEAAVSAVSTAQILRASGYSAAEAAALRALSDVAGRYIESLGRAAAALAEAHGRTEPNVADAVLALEEHAPGGFPGASDPTRPVLCSGALAELARFVAAVAEVPFAKPLPRRDPGSGDGKRWESFAAAEREPPLRHVPRWLPRFPNGWEERLRGRVEAAAKDEATLMANGDAVEVATLMANGDAVEVATLMANGGAVENGRRAVPENREKVSFRFGEMRRRHVVPLPPEKCGERFVKEQEKIM
ncbi:unnamed protein product [Urochloa decumbens]|uniref:Bromodomain associated domain-containing protein n=1 Tax=Urochloa decumbens TaxID=240449 RepID=A0ABC9CFY2_9POAL